MSLRQMSKLYNLLLTTLNL